MTDDFKPWGPPTAPMSLIHADPVIAKLVMARGALREATSLHQVKKILDVAAASEVYARRQQLGEEAIGYAHEIKIEALGRLGELLTEMPKATGAQYGGRRPIDGVRAEPSIQHPTYAELGLEKKTAAIAQQLAALPSETRQAIAKRETTLTEARRQQQHAERPAVTLPEGAYRVLYADPPWQYRDTRAFRGYAETAAEQDYPTMTCDELARLDVGALAADDAVLFCWATFPTLPDALAVVAAWGFQYKTAFVWAKPRGSFGHYHKADAEMLLVATRGRCTPDVDTRVSQIVHAETDGHSRKPEAVRALIDTLYPYGPRLELFARRTPGGPWNVWGNEPRG
jgi:N6-adenosine-specific RNA methylase IME4